MDQNDLLRLACQTNFMYLALGNECFEARGASFIVNSKTPRRHDANCVGVIRTEPSEVDALLARIEAEFAGHQHRTWGIDALTPPQTAARLALEQGYRANDALVHVLEGNLTATVRLVRAASSNFEVREVLTEDDWQAYRELDAMWWEETSTGYFGPYDPDLHDEFMVYRRLKAPQTRAWFACIEDVPRAFFSSWPGENGVGIVEDLYCHPDYRHRGLATALIAHAVADCRARGAGPVIINSDANDTPKLMYAAMGFRPLFVHRNYTKRLDAKEDAPA
jgi:GNAT superfamily N-acetyltransferase